MAIRSKLKNTNDTIFLEATEGRHQIHKWADGGNDTFILSFAKSGITNYSHGHHVYGGSGSDTFNFVNFNNVKKMVIGRLDDFDPSFDRIQLNGRTYDLNNLPSYAKVVEYDGTAGDSAYGTQQWLLVKSNAGGYLFYALEGARYTPRNDGASGNSYNEIHFVEINKAKLDALWAKGGVEYEDPFSFVPKAAYKYEDYINGKGNKDYIEIATHQNKTLAANDPKLVVDRFGDKDSYILGSLGHNIIYAGAGNDVIDGNRFNDKLYGESGKDLISGGGGDDFISGGADNDRIWGGDGNDWLQGDDGDDLIWAHNGHDTLKGGKGNDKLYGRDGNDKLYGDDGNDQLMGGANNDYLNGGAGNDRILGDSGNDTLTGGSGKDVFNFKAREGYDRITDFQLNYDKIEIEAVDKFSQLKIYAVSGGAMVNYGSGTIKLDDINYKQLDADDFMFV